VNEQPITPSFVTALLAISSDLNLRQTLQRIVESAREVSGARYSALGVLSDGADGTRLSEFLTAGLSEEEIAKIDHAPEGRGILGLLIDEPHGLRLHEIGEHPKSYGFPAGHPPMHTFLGAPIRIRDEVFGNLYLTDKVDGDFTEADEEVIALLATAAGIAINNARLYESARIREKRLDASGEITTAVLSSADADEVISIVADRARDLVEADFVLVFLPQPDGPLVAEIGSGDTEGRLHLVARTDGIVNAVAQTGETFVTGDLMNDPRVGATAFTNVGPAIVVPLSTSGRIQGVLFIGNNSGGHVFIPSDIAAAESLAAQASFALILAEGQVDRGKLLVLEERDRIARDLHDLVIQRIFATGLMLQSISRQEGISDDAQTRINNAMEQLDETIREVRSTITDLHDPSSMRTADLPSRLQLEASAAITLLGFTPQLELEGELTTVRNVDIIEQLVAVTREALTNVAKHAQARNVLVEAVAKDGRVRIRVIDDGMGLPNDIPRESGIKNIAMRAKRMKGEHYIGWRRDGVEGTEVEVHIPIDTDQS
jgi:signal transduction histidine kinase